MEEKQKNKKMWVIAGGALLLVLLFVASYWFFLRDKEGEGILAGTSLFGLFGDDAVRAGESILPPNEGAGSGSIAIDTTEKPRLRKLSLLPVAGAVFLGGTEGEPIVRFVEKEKGNIYEVNISTGKEVRVTRDTVLRLHEALLGDTGSTVLFRSLSPLGEIKSRLAQVKPSTATSSDSVGALANSSFLADGVETVSLSTNNKWLFIMKNVENTSSGDLIELATRNIRHVFDFPFTEWIPQLADSNTLFLTTKASGIFPGYSYEYRIDSKSMRKILDAIVGLTTLYSPSGKHVLYSRIEAGNFLLIGKDLAASTAEEIEGVFFYPEFATLPEKCVWSKNETRVYCGAPAFRMPAGLLPDAWYQGKVFFDDQVWFYDLEAGDSGLLAVPNEMAGESVDITAPFLSDDESTLFFINKRDGILWAYDIDVPQTGVLAPEEELTEEELKDARGSFDSRLP